MHKHWFSDGAEHINMDHVARIYVDSTHRDKYNREFVKFYTADDKVLWSGYADPDNITENAVRGVIPAALGFKTMWLDPTIKGRDYVLADIWYEDVIGWKLHEVYCTPITAEGTREDMPDNKIFLLSPCGTVTDIGGCGWNNLQSWLESMSKQNQEKQNANEKP